MSRRRGLMGQTAESWEPIISTWEQGQIGSDGSLSSWTFARRSSYINVQPGYQLRNDGPATGRDNKTVGMYVHEYTDTTWIKRTYLYPNGESICTISNGTNRVRLSFAYGSSSGMTMTQEDVDTYAKPMLKQ